MALRYSAAVCAPASEKYALTVRAKDVATNRLPAAVPGADHDGDRKHDQAAFADVGKQEGWDECKDNAENRDAVSEDWGPSRSNASGCE